MTKKEMQEIMASQRAFIAELGKALDSADKLLSMFCNPTPRSHQYLSDTAWNLQSDWRERGLTCVRR
jgi:hypothetical protein